jgi:aminoglycoside phosphotransferase
VYAAELDGRAVCLKVFTVDGQSRAACEWKALGYLERARYPLAPRPIRYDPSPSARAIAMDFLPGIPLAGQALTPLQLDRLGEAVDRLHELPAEDSGLPDARATAPTMLERVHQAVIDAAALPASFVQDCRRWLTSREAELLGRRDRPVFGKGDAGLGNFLWDGTVVRLVDFEYAGLSERAYDLAELVEHVKARAIPDTIWQRFLGERQLAAAELVRFTAARKLLAIFWALRLPAELARVQAAQVERVARLLRSDD